MRRLVAFAIITIVGGCAASQKSPDLVPTKSWEFAGMDDDTEHYPTQIFCTQSDDFNATSDNGTGVRLCVDYVPGLKRVALPKISYFARPQKDELQMQGDKSSQRVRLLRSWHSDDVKWRVPLWNVFIQDPSDKVFMRFIRAQRSIRVDGAVLNVSGGPWMKAHS
jgi:hypothetical protein